jgi:tRNA uridine 5-carbamoylmethylation protein Kti12
MLMITRGLPGSGKTVQARKWVAERPVGERIYTDRDSLRRMLFDEDAPLRWAQEEAVSLAQLAIIRAGLARNRSVVAADTNLDDRRLGPLLELAQGYNVPVEYIDLRHISVGTCVYRDLQRAENGGRRVGAEVIRAMAEKYGLPL